MNASSNVSQLDALHLELLHAAIPQQYDAIGVMMPGVAGRIGCRASAYRSAAKRLCRSGAENVESLLAAFLSDAQCRRTQGRGMGLMMSFTRLSTIFENAAPMITATARSRTLPLEIKA